MCPSTGIFFCFLLRRARHTARKQNKTIKCGIHDTATYWISIHFALFVFKPPRVLTVGSNFILSTHNGSWLSKAQELFDNYISVDGGNKIKFNEQTFVSAFSWLLELWIYSSVKNNNNNKWAWEKLNLFQPKMAKELDGWASVCVCLCEAGIKNEGNKNDFGNLLWNIFIKSHKRLKCFQREQDI